MLEVVVSGSCIHFHTFAEREAKKKLDQNDEKPLKCGFFSLCWQAENDENLHIWSSCPNLMLSDRHRVICYLCCFGIFRNINGEHFRTIWLTFIDNESIQCGFSDFLTLRRLDN